MKLVYNVQADKRYYTGVDSVVLFTGNPETGYAWEGITGVTYSPEGGDITTFYANNSSYVAVAANEKVKGKIKAYTFPEAFYACDGAIKAATGVYAAGQSRQPFSLVWASDVGSDGNPSIGKVYMIVYNATISPSEFSPETKNDSPALVDFEWEYTAIGVPCTTDGYSNTIAAFTVDTSKASPAFTAWFVDTVYGTATTDPTLPDPDTIISQAGALL